MQFPMTIYNFKFLDYQKIKTRNVIEYLLSFRIEALERMPTLLLHGG